MKAHQRRPRKAKGAALEDARPLELARPKMDEVRLCVNQGSDASSMLSKWVTLGVVDALIDEHVDTVYALLPLQLRLREELEGRRE